LLKSSSGFSATCSPGLSQAALDRSDQPAQMPRRLLAGTPFEVAENHGYPEALGQPVDLLVQHVRQVVVALGE